MSTDMNDEKVDTRNIPVTDNEKTLVDADSDGKPVQDLSKDELLEILDEARRISDQNYDLYVRSQAEMDNLKKRQKRDKEDWLKYATETLIKELLPSLDNLEKALAHVNSEQADDALRQGVALTLKGMKDALAKSGLVEISAQGEPFDPSYHEAVSQIEDSRVEPGTIVEELQRGYLLNNRLIRPAMVVVSKAPSSVEADRLSRACEKNH